MSTDVSSRIQVTTTAEKVKTPQPSLHFGQWLLCWNKVSDLERIRSAWCNNAKPLRLALFLDSGRWMRANTRRITEEMADLIVCSAPLIGRRARWVLGPFQASHQLSFDGPTEVRFGKHDAEQELGYAVVLNEKNEPLMYRYGFNFQGLHSTVTNGKPFTLSVPGGDYGSVNA